MDKKKALRFIEALQPHAGTTIKDEELSDAAKVINDYNKSNSEGKRFSLRGGQSRRVEEEPATGETEEESRKRVQKSVDHITKLYGGKVVVDDEPREDVPSSKPEVS